MELLVIIIVLALIFDYINGFHDAANSIATIVSTKVLTPFQAVIWAAFFNFVAFFIAKYLIGGFGNRSRRIFDDARTHYHIRLLQFVAGDILYVQIDSYHAVMEVEGLVHTQV